MNFRTTTLLFGILLGVLWIFGLMLAWRKSERDEGYILPRMTKESENINFVEVTKAGHGEGFAEVVHRLLDEA